MRKIKGKKSNRKLLPDIKHRRQGQLTLDKIERIDIDKSH